MASANHLLVIGRVKTRLFFLRGQFSFALLTRGAQILALLKKEATRTSTIASLLEIAS